MSDFANLAELNAHYAPRLFPKPGSEPQPREIRGMRPAPSAKSIAKHRKQYHQYLLDQQVQREAGP